MIMNTSKIIDTTSAAVANLVPAISGLTGNLAIASAGAVIAPIIQTGISELAHQVLGNLQRRKIMATANLICETVVNKLESEIPLRKDNFFDPRYNPLLQEKESPASKLLEGTLLKAKEEYDSKKLPFLSFLTSNIFFAPNISESKAFVLLEILEKLSYRQLCALSIFYKRNILPVGKWESRLKASYNLQDYYDIAYEFISLKDFLLIEQYIPEGGMGIGVSDYRITALGKDLYSVANLMKVDNQDVLALESKIDYISNSLQ